MTVDLIVTVSELQTEQDVALMQEVTRRGYTHPYFLDAGLLAFSQSDLSKPSHTEVMHLITRVRQYPSHHVSVWDQDFGGQTVRVHYANIPQHS